jgi:ElaB/YqjD/DUF883 family membrane-anchored ribosome-binding protein
MNANLNVETSGPNAESGGIGRQASTQQLVEDLKAVVSDAEALLKATSGQAGEKIGEARARAAESVKLARERLRTADAEARRRTREMMGDAEVYVKANPWQAVGIAAAAGLVLGLLLGRR